MADELPETLSKLLRQLRQDAGLTLEGLAAEAGISTRQLSDLENDKVGRPRASTVRELATALKLGEAGYTWLWAVARGQPTPNGLSVLNVTAPPHTLPRDIGSFAGRSPELAEIMKGAQPSRVVTIYAIAGLAGIGKTTLAVHAAHQLAEQFPDGQIFLSLNGHTPGQRPVAPADALATLLRESGAGTRQIPAELPDRARLWRHWLAGKRVLLLLDDAIDSEQVRMLMPGTAGSLVLITSRRNLTALEDARLISLDVLTSEEATRLLVRLADRPALDPADPAIEQIARLCGNLPLALGMLGRRLYHNPSWAPANLAAELAEARNRLEPMQAEAATVAAAFDLSYRYLTADQQQMFRRLGLLPGTDVDVWAAAALEDITPAEARHHLQALYDQNMIAGLSYGRYRLHDLIREYAGTLSATADPSAERDAATGLLLDFYTHTAAEAARHLARRTPSRPLSTDAFKPTHAPEISNRPQAAAWMTAEAVNLRAAVDYTVAHEHRTYAVAIAAAMHGFLRGHGHWDQALALHHTALEAARQASDLPGEACALIDLADIQYLTGEHDAAEISLTRALDLTRRLADRLGEASALIEFGILRQATGDFELARANLTRARALSRSQGDRLGEANALTNLGVIDYLTGKFAAAASNQELALSTYRSLGDELGEASALNGLGGVEQARGDYPAAVDQFTKALQLYRHLGDRIGEAYATGNLGAVQCLMGNYSAAASAFDDALTLYQDLGSLNGEADMRSNLGALHRMTEDYPSATASLTRAIDLYRHLEDPLGEAGALSELGAVQRFTGDYPAAIANLTRAVTVDHEIGERADEAEALNNLGGLYLASAMADEAHDAHTRALAIAAEIDLPLEEARAREGIGRHLLQSGDRAAGLAELRRAQAIYQDIGSPLASQVASTLTGEGPEGS